MITKQKRLEAEHQACHGMLFNKKWTPPLMTREVKSLNRPGYNAVNASEYEDEPFVLDAKVDQFIELVKKSKNCVVYSGAGISVSSGIPDYATKGKVIPDKNADLYAKQPTVAHKVLVSMGKAGHVKYWIQQNHDGLPQKAGFPQELMNEIHGSWFDPSNRVVPMKGHLRSDLYDDLGRWEEEADLVLVLGTSLAGMRADGVFHRCNERLQKQKEGGPVVGTIVISIQVTPHDKESSLRVFCKLDQFFELVAKKMKLEVCEPLKDKSLFLKNKFEIPYSKTGTLRPIVSKKLPKIILDLSVGANVEHTTGYYKGCKGTVIGRDADGHFEIEFIETDKETGVSGRRKRRLGSWWGSVLEEGRTNYTPIVNSVLTEENDNKSVMVKKETMKVTEKEDPLSDYILKDITSMNFKLKKPDV